MIALNVHKGEKIHGEIEENAKHKNCRLYTR